MNNEHEHQTRWQPKGDPEAYLHTLSQQRRKPSLCVQREPLQAAMEKLGARALSPPDVFEPYQFQYPLYIGVTTPQATTEVPHWHPDQAEAYVIIDGEAELAAKHREQDNGWQTEAAKGGDMIIVPPQSCHWFRWRTEHGMALVFKAPQRAGVGAFPAGKVICRACPHYKRGCVHPQGYVAQP
jgi:mannose-6-phosphate isomerase-like protein (cupin superfamily)